MTKADAMSYEAKHDAMRYLRANAFLNTLRMHMDVVTRQEFKALRDQALNGDVQGAEKELRQILNGRW